MEKTRISTPLLTYVTWLQGRHALDLELQRETTQVRSKSTTLKMSETFEKSIHKRIPRQENLDRALGSLAGAIKEPQMKNTTSPPPVSGADSPEEHHLTSGSARFVVFEQNPQCKAEHHGGKQFSAATAANKKVSRWDGTGFMLGGYHSRTLLEAGAQPGRLHISDRMQCHFSWVEANALLPGASAALRVTAHLAVACNGQLSYATHRLATLQASYEQLRSHHDLTTDSPESALNLCLNFDADQRTEIEVLELVELSATEQNGHAYLSGLFHWGPLHLCYSHAGQALHTPPFRKQPVFGPGSSLPDGLMSLG